MAEGSRAHFDHWAAQYDKSVSDREGYPFAGYRDVLDSVAALSRPSAGSRILDLGIGTGALSEILSKRGCHIWGLDFSEKMLDEARKRCPKAELFQADLEGEWPSTLPSRFDAVVSAYVFHHFTLADKIRLIERAMERVKADGRAVIGDIAFPSRKELAAASEKWESRWDPDEFYWTWEETREACAFFPWALTYRQVAECAGVLCIERRGADGAHAGGLR